MSTTDSTALQERIARILNDEGWTFEGVHEPGEYDECEDCRRVVDPIAARIAEEVTAHDTRVRREAAREALDGLAAELMEAARDCALGGDHRGAVAWRNASAHTHHRRDTHYPEETP